MSKTFDQSKDEIAKLCQYFTTNRKSFLAPGVKEAHVRQSLIDPFFAILGWDMRNASMVAPQFREVVTEDSLDIEGQQKAPDYTFRLGTLPKYYVEAKRCGINISADPAPAYQLRRYGFSAKLPLSILTDFEELGVYDCASRPHPGDKASHGRIQYFEFAEYPERWREVWDIFSREAIWSGAFDQYAASKRKRGTSEVDSEFLKDIEGWRDSLARNIALRNLYLDHDDLNNAVQRIIDRIIFLRMAEDRKLETYGQLLKLCDQPEIYSRFMKLCQKADEKYNSGIFHFQKEAGVTEEHDRLTPALAIDDKVLKPILQSIYFEHGCPYHFGVLPVEILGTVYERFLGKVIRLTAGHQAKVEEKPEVRKAGGVYYTPAYIVNYIVLNTVGKQIEGKSPADLAGGKTKLPFRVLDMACGSGSFLLGAYQFLLDHCLKWYQANPAKKHDKAVYENAKGEICLSIAERKRILTTHIFGVDIDRQAVETTKLSLLLKALEGENDSSLSKQMSLFHERALPNLSDNIKCGNSLIASDFSMIPEDLVRVNAFDWPAQFPDAMKAGGFDAIIGNPPYIRIQTLQESDPESVNYLKEHYAAAAKGNYDIYVVFVEHALSLLNSIGRLGYILPHKFFNAKYGQPLRKIIADGRHLTDVVHFGDQQVFTGATTYTCLLFLNKNGANKCNFSKVDNLAVWRVAGQAIAGVIPCSAVIEAEWNFAVGAGAGLFEKLRQMPVKLGDVAKRIFQGFKTGADPVFILDERPNGKYYSNALETEICIENKYLRPLYKSGEMKRYDMRKNSRFVIFPYQNGTLINWNEITEKAPKTAEYLTLCKNILAKRERGHWVGSQWYCYSRNQALEIMDSPKILTADLNPSANYCIDKLGKACFPGGAAGGYGIVLDDNIYVLGLLNSKTVDYYHKQISTNFRGGWYGYDAKVIRNIPIRSINFSNSADRVLHDKLVGLVEKMLTLTPRLRGATSESEKAALHNAITTTDSEIDCLVYQLYGLTDAEIKMVEGERWQ